LAAGMMEAGPQGKKRPEREGKSTDSEDVLRPPEV
jgi:hypothetical protein